MFSISDAIKTNMQMEALVSASVLSMVEVEFLPLSILYPLGFTLTALLLKRLDGDAYELV